MRYVFVIFVSALSLSSCAPTLFMGGATSVATTVADDRGVGGVFSDAGIKAKILSLYAGSEKPLVSSLDVVVRQGRVLLSGNLDDPQAQIEAIRLAWKVGGVKEVLDETKVSQGGGFTGYAKDTFVSTQVKTKLLFDGDVNSINFTVHTIDGVVYVMGIAQNQTELDTVIHSIRNTSGVKQVISYVQIKDNPESCENVQGESY